MVHHRWDEIFNDKKRAKDGHKTKQEPRVHQQQRYQSRVPFTVEGKKGPPGLDLSPLPLWFAANGYSILPGIKALKCDPAPENGPKIAQIPHKDHKATPGYDRAKRETGHACSVLVAIFPTDVDIWESDRALKAAKRKPPSHPNSIAKVTVHLEPGDMLVFCFDVWHAGRGYSTLDNLRLFLQVIPFCGSPLNFEDGNTHFEECSCMAKEVEEAKQRHKPIPSAIYEDNLVCRHCDCPPRTKEGPSYEEWKKKTQK